MSEEILKVENLEGYYKGTFGVVQAVDGVTFNVKKGEILGIAGESGCGKSTLAELITGTPKPLLYHRKGQVFVNDVPIYIEMPEIKEIKILNLQYFTGILKKINGDEIRTLNNPKTRGRIPPLANYHSGFTNTC